MVLVDGARVEVEDVGHHPDLGAGAADGLADVLGLDAGELFGVLLDERGDASKQPCPVGRGDRPPGREGGLRPCDGGVRLIGRRSVDLADDLLGRRIENGGHERSSR